MKTDIRHNLARLGLTLPEQTPPLASYIPVRLHAGLAFVSGQLPLKEGALLAVGQVPDPVAVDRAAECAARCALNALAALHAAIAGFDRIAGVVKVEGFVACPPGFADHPRVINGASNLLVELMGEAGRHARAAVGVPSLPMNAPVEVAFTFAVHP